jgi:DNA-binding NarL/FixJ family response regulator
VSALLRVFLIGLEQGDLDALRVRTRANGTLQIAGTAFLHELERGAVRVPDSIEAIVMSPAALAASRRGHPPRVQESDDARAGGRTIVEELTTREREVLALLADGRANRHIAARLGISEHTVKFHLASIFGKLGVSTRTEAVRRALDWNLIDI